MTEPLVKYDPIEVLEKSREILKEEGILPPDCPDKNCLSIGSVILTADGIRVWVNARPPELPTNNPGWRYELNPICEKKCGIEGNCNRRFEITQDQAGPVTSAKPQWRP